MAMDKNHPQRARTELKPDGKVHKAPQRPNNNSTQHKGAPPTNPQNKPTPTSPGTPATPSSPWPGQTGKTPVC